jgi:citronellol/citronellal dehydrogenase
VKREAKPVAVVAGGGSGIGRGAALRLAEQGYRVVLVGRTAGKLEAVAAEIAAAGGQAEAFAGDVRDWNRMAELGAAIVAGGGLDILVNSAGGQFAQPSAELSESGWKSVVELNLHGSFYLCRHLYAALRMRRGAAVMVVADLWQKPAPGLAHSAAARAGVVSLVRSLALEWARDGVRLNALSPGLTDTPALRPEYRVLGERVPLGRIGTVEEVVEALLFLARAGYITGEVLSIDGGLRLV